jgi:hypothetical protein
MRKNAGCVWGRLVTCGRLAIGPLIFLYRTRRIANPPQVTNLPHAIGIDLLGGTARILRLSWSASGK